MRVQSMGLPLILAVYHPLEPLDRPLKVAPAEFLSKCPEQPTIRLEGRSDLKNDNPWCLHRGLDCGFICSEFLRNAAMRD